MASSKCETENPGISEVRVRVGPNICISVIAGAVEVSGSINMGGSVAWGSRTSNLECCDPSGLGCDQKNSNSSLSATWKCRHAFSHRAMAYSSSVASLASATETLCGKGQIFFIIRLQRFSTRVINQSRSLE
jgi:hypothetical protein